MKTRKDKEHLAAGLAKQAKDQTIMIFSSFTKIPVARQQQLRRALKKENAEYKVAKKTIVKRVLESSGLPYPIEGFKGEVGITFGYGDEVAPAKVLAKFKRENPDGFDFIAGILSGKALSGKEVVSLSKLPGKQELIAQLVGVIASPIRGFMNVLNGNQRKLVVALAEIAKQKS